MVAWQLRPSMAGVLTTRRQRLAALVDGPAIFWSGRSIGRNYPDNLYPFRANSHFLYFAGAPLENAAIRLEGGNLELFIDEPGSTHALWHGPTPSRSEIAQWIGADSAYALADLEAHAAGAATLPVQDAATSIAQARLLERPVSIQTGRDLALAEAVIALRLTHDEGAIEELRRTAAVSVAAHKAGMQATRRARSEAEVRAAIESAFIAHQMGTAYNSIVTVHGEVLHNEHYYNPLQPGDLLLVDAGAESELGWASDITRTWPVSGRFSASQRALYDVVLAAHDDAIALIKPGVEYRDVHLAACRTIAAGLVDLGILRGQAEDLVEADAHALFFPHGVGHLIGLDVHDMEDLGDLAGYAPGRSRSHRFGLGYLRLDRTLTTGMATTIEPGFYQVPAILDDPTNRERYRQMIDWERLEQFADVRGIRIEDDVLVTSTGAEVLTADLPTQAEAIEDLVG
ncbi:aminopeptidase P family protein [Gloeobacter kilaueensis]|uniref:Xaa-Pro aminopeptidase n=1 Tax=Gloeobacter kilaueensis (strain ATCC BAA-2537 / CCAP 1431/1 / ULC 316 / JS1) TaxID=1183438 RepID=U5QKC9_GLOK1|nr:aminopeptidase P family protein [Gloeobacter kilaueensis]AGY59313.1 Xaa-Pro dipeptidase [Gloeobacter kilaueensis JS1]